MGMEHSDFAVAVYLNQAVVFDLLAIMEDGMAQVSTIRTSESKKAGTKAGIGASNVFALLGVRLKGSLENADGREITQERVHTPLSLFAKVRTYLQKAKLVHDLTREGGHITDVRAGHFVEMIRMASAGIRGLATREWPIVYPKDAPTPSTKSELLRLRDQTTDEIEALWPRIPPAAISGSRQGVRRVGRHCLRAVPLLDRQRDPSSRARIRLTAHAWRRAAGVLRPELTHSTRRLLGAPKLQRPTGRDPVRSAP
jgi:hypothetical protein